MITTAISSKNQITLPKFILELLSINSGDKVLLSVEKEAIMIKPRGKSLVDFLAASVKVAENKKGVSFNKALAETKTIAAKDLANK